jgi:hypothetical protein
MYRVEYYCPRQSPYWQVGNRPVSTFDAAVMLAQIVKPPNGSARVLDMYGNVVYEI